MRSEDTATPHFTLNTRCRFPVLGDGSVLRRVRKHSIFYALNGLRRKRRIYLSSLSSFDSLTLAQDDIGWFVRSLKNNKTEQSQ